MTKMLGPPTLLRTAFDFVKGGRDLAVNISLSRFVNRLLPQGDGHPVLVLPGFLAGDYSTGVMRGFLQSKGYNAQRWELGANWGPSPERLQGLEDRLLKIYKDNNNQKISIVGWSLGGLYAREMARKYPDIVRNAISLGSPFHAANHPDCTAIGGLFRLLNPHYKQDVQEVLGSGIFEKIMEPLATPMTSIYTRHDGIVNWRACILPENGNTENVEVRSSHLGLGLSARAAVVLADRLAHTEQTWEPFDRHKYPFVNILPEQDNAHRLSSWTFSPQGPTKFSV